MTETVDRWRPWAAAHREDLLALGLYATARLVLLTVGGLRMDLRFLGFAPHLPDVALLEDRLAETLWYTHTQPPLYAGLVGLLLKVSPFPDGATFLVAHLALGATLVVVLRRLFATLGLGRPATFVALALIVVNPSLVAIELIASYDMPTIVLLAALALTTARYAGSGSARDLTWISGLALAIVLTRTIFHPVWFVLVVAGVLAMRRPSIERRRVAAIVGAPLLVLALLIAKNVALYDLAGLTSFAGPSISKLAGAVATDEEVRELRVDAEVSAIFGRPVFWGYDTYVDAMPPCRRDRPDIAVLAQQIRTEGGYPNMNDECMLAVYRLQGDDGVAYLRAHPDRFAAAQAEGAQMFFEPALPIVFTSNAEELRGQQAAWRWTPLYAQVQVDPIATTEFGGLRVLDHGGIEVVPAMLLADLAAISLGVQRAIRLVRRRDRSGGGARRASYGAWAAVGLTCAWVTGVGSLLEINENARYRMLIEPFLLATVAYAAQEAWRWAQARRTDGEPDGQPGSEPGGERGGSGGRVEGAAEEPRLV